jgi:hypothetical protein
MSRIAFTLVSVKSFTDRVMAEHVVDCLVHAPALFRPTTYGIFEPATFPINSNNREPIVDSWLHAEGLADAGSLILQAGEVAEYQVAWSLSGDRFPFLGGSVATEVLKADNEALSLYLDSVRELALEVEPVYGEIRNTAYPGCNLPFDLKVRLPDVPWVSMYGLPYLEHFGIERIRSAPFDSVTPLSDTMIWAQATSSVFVEVTDQTKKIIRQHLGEDSFMRAPQWRYQSGSAPALLLRDQAK